MVESKPDEGFKVVDRRLFNEQGELRNEIAEQERSEQEAAAKKAAIAAQQVAPAEKPAPADAAEATSPSETIQPSRGFQMLVDFLTRNAAAMLGGMADPRTGQAFLDLEGAREMIEMIDTLREKTRGNLAKVDEDLVLEVAGSLKLTYMEIAKAAADQMTKKAGVNVKK